MAETPHITELLDLTSVVAHGTRLTIATALEQSGVEPSSENVQEAMDSMRVVDLQALRTSVLKLAYPVARVIAEQAWRRGAEDHYQEDLRELEQAEELPLVADRPRNPFAEGEVLT
jgi:hypothetical protein